MSLFAFDFKCSNTQKSPSSSDDNRDLIIPNHMPTSEEACSLELGRVEYSSVIKLIVL